MSIAKQKVKLASLLKAKSAIYCEECNHIFFESANAGLISIRMEKPPKGYYAAAVHHFETGHTILATTPLGVMAMSNYWDSQAARCRFTRADMLEASLKRLKQNE